MAWRLVLSPAAEKDMDRLPARDAQAVAREMDRLAEDPRSVDLKKLRGRQGEWRMRVGDWRVRFTFHKSAGVIEVYHVLRRGGAYKE